MIKYFKPNIGQEEKEGVIKVLESGHLTSGSVVEEFEEMFTRECGTKYAIAVNSCTSALHLSLIALGMGFNSYVCTSPYTYCATWQAIQYLNADPYFIDINKDDFNINSNYSMLEFDCIIPIHIAGKLCDMNNIKKIAQNNNAKIIEDCAHRFPSELYGDIACYSFYANKLITTGEGGMIVTNNKDVKDKLHLLRYHGRDKYSGDYDIQCIGYKYNMSDINAAIGVEQLKTHKQKKYLLKGIAQRYNGLLNINVKRLDIDSNCHWHLYPIWFDDIQLSSEVKKALQINNIEYSHHYKLFNDNKSETIEAFKKSKTEISLPLYCTLQDWEIEKICRVINDCV